LDSANIQVQSKRRQKAR